MPRAPRLDYVGALPHVIVRGIERREILGSDRDRRRFLGGLGDLIHETRAALVSRLAVYRHGITLTAVARHLGVSVNSIARGVTRGEHVLKGRTLSPTDFDVE